MPRYEANPAAVSATFTVLPKDEYVLQIGKPKTFTLKTQKGDEQYGISYPITVVDGPMKGKKISFRGQEENEMGQGTHKRFQMAALGFEINDRNEQEFNEKYSGQDFSFDTDSNFVGEFYRQLEGKVIRAQLDVTLSDKGDGKEYQKWVSVAPYTAG